MSRTRLLCTCTHSLLMYGACNSSRTDSRGTSRLCCFALLQAGALGQSLRSCKVTCTRLEHTVQSWRACITQMPFT